VREHPVLRRTSFFLGRAKGELEALAADERADVEALEKDVYWVRADGQELSTEDWSRPDSHVLGMLLPGHHADDPGGVAGRTAATLLLLLNGGAEPVPLTLPGQTGPGRWETLLDTSDDAAAGPAPAELVPHSLLLLRFAETGVATVS